MKQLAEDLYVFEGFPPHAINCYLAGDVLIDSGTRFAAGRLLRRLRKHKVSLHALTHAHPDHQGSSHVICETLQIPLWCGAADADAMEQEGEILRRLGRHWLIDSVGKMWTGPAHPVAKRLREGDQVGTFTVLETPGHSVGHISFWREQDRVLIMGDLIANIHIWTGIPMLREPEAVFSVDPAQNRRSARRILELDPRLVCFGHGAPMRNPKRLMRYLERLPE
jgi:glyoxylase-like metal-dependent hydrolase (beta-lactamase superfamily II)